MTTTAAAIVFDAPQTLSVQTLALKPLAPGDVEIAVSHSGISTGTERLLWDGTMPAFPGLGYPLVPGYETVGTVVHAAEGATLALGSTVFVPGSYSFEGVRNIFGGAGARLRVPCARVVPVAPSLGPRAVLLALAATCHHALVLGRRADVGGPPPVSALPDLVVGHGVMGRLLARITLALGGVAPTVWETQALRRGGADGYACVHPDDDARKDYRRIVDVSGDSALLDRLIARLAPGGEVVLAGFYKQPLSFAFAPAFMREASIRVAAQWQPQDLQAVAELAARDALSLDGLITHTLPLGRAREAYATAFGDPQCLKMMLSWQD